MILLNGKEVEFGTFPNGETLFKKDGLKAFTHNMVSFKYENDSDLIKLMMLKGYIDHYSTRNTLTIYYMPYSRMDRSEDYSPFTLKYVADFINSLNFYEVYIIEPHSDVTSALINDVLPLYINFSLVEKVKKEIVFDDSFDYLVFPDSGASKRYAKMQARNVLVGHKHRNFQTGQIESLQLVGDTSSVVNSSVAVIVDDLSSYGGTFVRTSKELRKLGFSKVYLLVAHAENSIFKGELFDHVDKVFTTDSILTEQDHWNVGDKLHIFELNNPKERILR